MKDFDWTQFSKRIYINANIRSVYDAWTKAAEIEKWFLSKAEFYLKNGEKLDPSESVKSECRYKWSWFAQSQAEEGVIFQVNGKTNLEFSFAGNCKVQVKLIEEKTQTLVQLTQTEIPLDESSKENIRLGCAFGWSFYLVNLKSVLEGGLDLRNKNTELKDVVNN